MSTTIRTQGLHHITAIAADPQKNIDFYEGFLGQRFVKRTVNFDDPSAYHLYYGDYVGSPGTAMTFFSWQGMPSGVGGVGETNAIVYRIPKVSRPYWSARAQEYSVLCKEIHVYGRARRCRSLIPMGISSSWLRVLKKIRQQLVAWNESPDYDRASAYGIL
jgi:catechol 2,3-dioxygenase-like lactoylglutathione lyase family enzyme